MDITRICLLVVLCSQATFGKKILLDKHHTEADDSNKKSLMAEKQDGPVAVSVARTTPETSHPTLLALPDVVVDIGNSWDQATNTLTVPADAVYFFHLNIGAMAGEWVNVDLQGAVSFADIIRLSNVHDGADTLSRSFISRVEAGASIFLLNDEQVYSDGGRQTSLTALDLTGYLNADPIIFSAARTKDFTDLGTVIFDDILINIGQNFNNASENIFQASVDGTYFFTFSVGMSMETSVRAQIIKNHATGGEGLSELYRAGTDHNGPDTTGSSIMVDLVAGDTVQIELESGELHSDTARQVFFGGFRYDPALVPAAAWCVYRETPAAAMDPLAFDASFVNTDSMFNFTDFTVTITESGVYYVSLSVGAEIATPVDVYIARDRSRVEANIYRETSYHKAYDTLSQGTLLRLSEGNTLRVVIREGSEIYSDGDRQTVFTGFLIAP